MAGSRTLAMLASFDDGKKIIKQILAKKTAICIFSYRRSTLEKITKKPKKDPTTQENQNKSEECQQPKRPVHYRASTINPMDISDKKCKLEKKSRSANENVLTVLLENEWDFSLYNALLNRIILDSKKLGPGCLSALADVLLFLQEDENTGIYINC